jgi:RNA polymerase sigma-70 factor (ECF subfamily)
MQIKDPQYADFVQLIREHERLVHKVCSFYARGTEDAKDLFQEIVLQAWRSYSAFKGSARPGTWLYRVALNTAMNHSRKEKRQQSLNSIADWYALYDAPDVYNEEYQLLHRMIDELPPLEKALILLYLEDRSYQEISEILGLSVSNVGTKLGRIRAGLKSKAAILIK